MEKSKVLQLFRDKNVSQIEVLVESGYDFNSLNREINLLNYLIEHSSIEDDRLKEVVELLLGMGISVNISGIFSKQPIYSAAEKGFKDICEILSKYGGDMERKYSSLGLHIFGLGKTPTEIISNQ